MKGWKTIIKKEGNYNAIDMDENLCPICGKYQMKHFGDYCPVCGWEHDVIQSFDYDFEEFTKKTNNRRKNW